MARSREFDLEKATEAAMKLFWARGYMATSLPDLLETVGIARSRFYATFGTKRQPLSMLPTSVLSGVVCLSIRY